MKAARLLSFRTPFSIETVPDPEPGPEDAIVRVRAAGVCRSDLHIWQGELAWVGIRPQLPIILGHEFGGEVVAVGRNVRRFAAGDRVTVPFHNGCGRCPQCQSGRSNLCDEFGFYGATYDGCFAEYVRVPNADFNLIRLPDEVDVVTAAAMGCRYMTGFHAVMRGRVQPGEWVAVHGAGGVGLSAIQTAHAIGAQVIAVDIDDDKLEKARAEGAVVTINSRREERVFKAIKQVTRGGAHVSIDALGLAETVFNSVRCLRKGGRHVQVGLTSSSEQGMVALPVDIMTTGEIEFIGSFGNPHVAFDGLMRLVAAGRLRPKALVEREVGLAEVNDVIDRMLRFETKGFNVITSFA